jgi:septum formation protein
MKYSAAPLYLASGSRMRRELLRQAKIPFSLIQQNADEDSINWQQEPTELVKILSRLKMDHAIIPNGTECYVITADTICIDIHGAIHGKPKDYKDAITMLKLWREGSTVITGFCIDKKAYTATGSWKTIDRQEGVVSTSIDFSIPDEWLDIYLKETPSMSCAGAMAIEEYGFQFVKSINGSYSNIIGLPMYEVRLALESLGFFVYT